MKQVLLLIAVVIGQSVLAADKARSFLAAGTGFFVTADGYLLTNNHVVDGASRITIKINGKELPAKVVKSDKLFDLAVLKVAGKFSALPIVSSHKVGLGDDVFTVGFPQIAGQNLGAFLAKGSINGLTGIRDDPREFQISVPVQPGDSGGPLVDEYGNVVGVVVARLNALKVLKETGRIPQNVNYAVKGTWARAFLEALPAVASKIMDPIPRTKTRKFSDVVKEVQAATVLILVRSDSPDTATPPNTAQPTGPISAYTLLRQFRDRGIKVWLKSDRDTTRTDTILVQQGDYVYALLHTSDTPFPISPKAAGISRVEPTLSTPEAGKAKPVAYTLPFAQFLKDEPRILASPLMNVPQAAERGIRPYQIAAKPYQFPKAFIISRNGNNGCEVEFKLNRAHKGYVKIDTRFAATLFLSSKGDIVLSQKGELLGMMANNTYCYVISNLKSESSIAFRKDLNRALTAKSLKTHHATIQRKAVQLRTDRDTPEPTTPEPTKPPSVTPLIAPPATQPPVAPKPVQLTLPTPPASIGLGVITGTRVSARGKATVHSQLVFRFGQNEPVNLLEEITLAAPKAGEPRKWYRVQVPLDAGLWVHHQFLHNQRIVTIVGNDGKPSPHTYASVKPNRLNVHGGAGDAFPVLGQLSQGTDVALTGAQNGKWLEIFAPSNCSVFVRSEFVKIK